MSQQKESNQNRRRTLCLWRQERMAEEQERNSNRTGEDGFPGGQQPYRVILVVRSSLEFSIHYVG